MCTVWFLKKHVRFGVQPLKAASIVVFINQWNDLVHHEYQYLYLYQYQSDYLYYKSFPTRPGK